MCQLEVGCDFKPLSPIKRRNDLGFDEPCCISPNMCEHFRGIRSERRLRAAFSAGQMDLSLHFIYTPYTVR